MRKLKLPDDGTGIFATVSAVVAIVALVMFFFGAPFLGWPLALGVLTGCLVGIALIVFRKA